MPVPGEVPLPASPRHPCHTLLAWACHFPTSAPVFLFVYCACVYVLISVSSGPGTAPAPTMLVVLHKRALNSWRTGCLSAPGSQSQSPLSLSKCFCRSQPGALSQKPRGPGQALLL